MGQPVLVAVRSSSHRTTLMARLATLQFQVVVAREERDLADAFVKHRRFGLVVVDAVMGPGVGEFLRTHEDARMTTIRTLQVLEGSPPEDDDDDIPPYDGIIPITISMEDFGKCVNGLYRMW